VTRCAFCHERATEHDHVTGRRDGARSPYLDVGLWAPCCRRCNTLHVQCWRTLGIAHGPATPATRLRRLSFGAARLAVGPCLWAPEGVFWDSLARLATEAADLLEGTRR
jgi:hypothetical protein